jgi:hypothetical protein
MPHPLHRPGDELRIQNILHLGIGMRHPRHDQVGHTAEIHVDGNRLLAFQKRHDRLGTPHAQRIGLAISHRPLTIPGLGRIRHQHLGRRCRICISVTAGC